MRIPWLLALLSAAAPFLPGCGVEAKPSLGPANVVWRGETRRTPEQVRAAGGMYARGVERQLRGIKYTPAQVERGSSLYLHTAGSNVLLTPYISTTSDPREGLTFGGIGNPRVQDIGYLYMIRVDSKIIDVRASLGSHFAFEEEAEQAVVGHIPMDHIEGWYDIKMFSSKEAPTGPEIIKILSKGGKIEALFEPNPDFNEAKYPPSKGSGAQPQLAGFRSKSEAWQEKKWKKYKDQKVAPKLRRFVKKHIPEARENKNAWEWARTPALGSGADLDITEQLSGEADKARAAARAAREAVRQAVEDKVSRDDATRLEQAARDSVNELMSLGEKMIAALDDDGTLDPSEVGFDDTMEEMVQIRKASIQANLLIMSTESKTIVKNVEKARDVAKTSRNEDELKGQVSRAEEGRTQLRELLKDAKKVTETISADKAKISDMVNDKAAVTPSVIQELIMRLFVLRMSDARETGLDALVRESKALDGELDALKAGLKKLEKRAKEVDELIAETEKSLERFKKKQGEKEEKEKQKEKEKNEKDEKKKKKKEEKEAKSKELQKVKDRAMTNVEAVAGSDQTSSIWGTLLGGAGIILGSIGLGVVATGQALGMSSASVVSSLGVGGGSAMSAGAFSSGQAADLLESMQVTAEHAQEMARLVSANPLEAVSEAEIESLINEYSPKEGLGMMEKGAPPQAPPVPDAVPELARRSDASRNQKMWAAAAMEEPKRLALSAAFQAAVERFYNETAM